MRLSYEKYARGTHLPYGASVVQNPPRKNGNQTNSHSDETPRGSSASTKRRKTSLLEEKNARVQESFEKLKAQHGSKYTGPQYRLWAEAMDVGQHSSYDEPPQGSYFSVLQGKAHGVRKDGSNDVLTTAVSSLATSLAAALEPRHASSENAADLSTPPQAKSRSPVITPV